MADNPELQGQQVQEVHIDPETWRNVVLQMTKEAGGVLDVVLLRPLDWVTTHNADIGGTIKLDLAEFGAVGPVQVLSIDPCPSIEEGPGRIVTATFAHSSADILEVSVQGLGEPIGTTASHPFWSEDRQAFVAAGELDLGEQLLLTDGKRSAVTSVVRRSTKEPVYNIEVDGEHVYYVSNAGVLVHNMCAPKRLLAPTNVADHHIIPMFRGKSAKYAKFISDRGIDVDQFTITLAHGKASHHLKFIHGQGKWNKKWMDWIDANPNATAKDIYQFAGKMMDDFNLSGFPIHPYGG
jgi:hypothetical protein